MFFLSNVNKCKNDFKHSYTLNEWNGEHSRVMYIVNNVLMCVQLHVQTHARLMYLPPQKYHWREVPRVYWPAPRWKLMLGHFTSRKRAGRKRDLTKTIVLSKSAYLPLAEWRSNYRNKFVGENIWLFLKSMRSHLSCRWYKCSFSIVLGV